MKITLCGSARFEQEFHRLARELTLAGHVLYSLSVFPSFAGSKNWYSEEQKVVLDLVHLAKIEESDAVLIIDVDGYIGESTRREIAWARIRGKRIALLSRPETWKDLLGET
jgi:predicted amidohydrolase